MATARSCTPDESYRSYLVKRLERSIHLAQTARDEAERAAHLRACRHYCALLGNVHLK